MSRLTGVGGGPSPEIYLDRGRYRCRCSFYNTSVANFGVETFVHHYSDVANALSGCGPTDLVCLFAFDTERSLCSVEPGGVVETHEIVNIN